MDGVQITWSFAILEALAFALVGAVEGELKVWKQVVHPRLFLYLRGLLATGAFIGSQVYAEPSQNVLIALGGVAVFLGVLGYWPQIQKIGDRAQGNL